MTDQQLYSPIDITHQIACGIDVHKQFLIAVVCDETKPGEPVYYKQRFSLFTKDLRKLVDWLISLNCSHVCMESTGQYWVPVFRILENKMKEVRVVNPKWVKQVRGEKDDQKDAVMICNKYRHGETKSSFIPNKDIRGLRGLTRLETKMVNELTAICNRINIALVANNYRLDSVFSTIKTKSAQRILEIILNNDTWTDEQILECVDRRCKASRKDILAAVDGIPFDQLEKDKLQVLLAHKKVLEAEIKLLQSQIEEACKEYLEIITVLMTIPGVGKRAAQCILAEIGDDMSIFANPARLARWAGLAQDRNESADRKYSNRIGQGGKYLKPIMVQCAWAAVKSKNPYYKAKFENIQSRRGTKRAIVAIARKMVVSIWAMLTYGSEWNPVDKKENGCPRELSIRKSISKLDHAVSELIAQGKDEKEITRELNSIIQKHSTKTSPELAA